MTKTREPKRQPTLEEIQDFKNGKMNLTVKKLSFEEKIKAQAQEVICLHIDGVKVIRENIIDVDVVLKAYAEEKQKQKQLLESLFKMTMFITDDKVRILFQRKITNNYSIEKKLLKGLEEALKGEKVQK